MPAIVSLHRAMVTFLLFGFLIGLRHALEADHLAAVASMTRREGGWIAGALRGATWGLGHTITLLLVGGACLLLGAGIPEPLGRASEAVVGVMLVGLGAQVLWRLRRQHADGAARSGAYSRPTDRAHRPEEHELSRPGRFEGRAMAVGLVHGLAGSAALVLLTLETVGDPWSGIAYIALFGLGSMVGMAVLSLLIAVPFQLSGRFASGMIRGVEGTVGLATLVLGCWVLVQQASLV